MILDWIMGALIGLWTGFFALFPSYELPDSVSSVGSSLGASVSTVNGIFPIVTLGACLLVMIGARLFVALWAGISWVYGKIPLKFT